MPVKQEGGHGNGEASVRNIHEPPPMAAQAIAEQFHMDQSFWNFLVGEILGIKTSQTRFMSP